MESARSRFEAALEGILKLLERSGVELGYLFGSAARDAEHAGSDLDIAVLAGGAVPRERHGELQVQLLTELVGLTHVNDIDLVLLDNAPPLLAFNAISTGRLFFERSSRKRIRFETRTVQRYIDTRPLRKYVADRLARRLRDASSSAARE
jgi:predicted nucleotidyltransferase